MWELSQTGIMIWIYYEVPYNLLAFNSIISASHFRVKLYNTTRCFDTDTQSAIHRHIKKAGFPAFLLESDAYSKAIIS